MHLHDYISNFLNSEFIWGKHDCVTWVINWGSIVVSKNLLLPYGEWHDKRSAMKAIERAGGLENAFSKSAYLVEIKPAFAKDGDITIIEKSAFLFSGEHAVGVGKKGLVFKNRLLGERAWTYVTS